MKHATSRELYEYWERIRGSARAPLRSAIEPSDIRKVLADTFILEVVNRETYQVRLAGTRICAAYGREIKGQNFLDLWTGEDRQAMATLAAAVCEDAAAAVLTLGWTTERERCLTAELLLLPLRQGDKGCDRILGSLAPFERPYWLGSEPVVRQPIASLRLVWPSERQNLKRRASDRPQNGPAILFPIDQSRRRGHLFVLDGGKD